MGMRIVHHSRHIRPFLLIVGLIILGLAISVMIKQTFSKNVPAVETPQQAPAAAPFKLSSPVFKNLENIPIGYTCTTEPKTPPLVIENAPGNTKEFAIVMRDTSTEEGDKAHWVVWGIPASTTVIAENTLPQGTVQGTNDDKTASYLIPCPTTETGEHIYTFDLYALSDTIRLDASASKDGLIAAINGKVIAKVQLTGKASRLNEPQN